MNTFATAFFHCAMLILHADITGFSTTDFNRWMNELPATMREQVLRYRRPEDQQTRLLARMLLQRYWQVSKAPYRLNQWQTDGNGKPFVPGSVQFNISHSGRKVIVAITEVNAVGIDVELMDRLNVDELKRYFHPEEIEFLETNEDQRDAFYNIWTRKEAYLKATGTGIVHGLDKISVLEDEIEHSLHNLQVKSLNLFEGYKAAVCGFDLPMELESTAVEVSLNAIDNQQEFSRLIG